MKGKINLKTIIILVILVLVIILGVLGMNVVKTYISGASADFEPKNLSAVSTTDGTSATVSWTTDKAATASVFYGTNMASLLLMAEDSASTTDHKILLTNLRSGKTYYYKIVVGDNEFDNGGTMFTFKTLGDDAATVVPTIATPTIPVVTLPTTTVPITTITPTKTSTSTGTTNCNKTTDYNKDGTINSLDYIMCVRGKLK